VRFAHHQVAVAVMKEFQVGAWKDAATEAKDFATHLHDTWHVGNADCNNGIVLLLATENRQASKRCCSWRRPLGCVQ
jgi:uncharacterized membrane protein YgcG